MGHLSGDGETKVKLETNRTKAIVAMNFYALFSIIFVLTCKYTVNESKVDPIDLIFIVNAMSFPISAIIILTTSRSFIIPEASRRMFFTRVFLGWLQLVVVIIGSSLVPLTVQ